MNTDLSCYVSPMDKSELRRADSTLVDATNIAFQIVNQIPRFVRGENYSESFGLQWNIFQKTQLDSFTSTTITKDRFFDMTGWTAGELRGANVLEVGSGAGRFTEVILETGANLFSVEYSDAVEANARNNGDKPNLRLCQASVYELPFRENFFDKIFCFGVLQHTPDVKQSFFAMIPYLRKGGEIAIDVYSFNWKTIFYSKYWFRPITKRMSKDRLLSIVRFITPKWFPISTVLLQVPFVGKFLAQIIPICNYSNRFPQLTRQQLIEWAILDTFDMLSPEYDQPQSLKTVESWFRDADLEILFCGKGDNGYVARGRKK